MADSEQQTNVQSTAVDEPTAAVGSPVAEAIPRFRFDGTGLSASENIVAWQQSVVSLFDTDRFADASGKPFEAVLDSFALGAILFGRTKAGGQRFRRTGETIARSGIDHVIVQLYVEGGYHGVAADTPIVVSAGDICVLDLAQTLETHASAFECFTLVVPRPLLERALPQPEALHGLVLRGDRVLTRLLAQHFLALFAHAPELTVDECQAVVEGTLSLIIACLKGEIEDRTVAQKGSASVISIKQYIEQHLGDQNLSAETIAAHFGMSRATLYRQFTVSGGVAHYIRSRRLHRAFFELAQPTVLSRRIGSVAKRWSFSSLANFNRAFKAAYGITPGAARMAATPAFAHARQADDKTSALTRWMLEIAAPQNRQKNVGPINGPRQKTPLSDPRA